MSRIQTSENKYGVYSAQDCTEKFCKLLREQALKIINKRTTRIGWKSTTLAKEVCTKYTNDQNYGKFRNYCHSSDKHRDAPLSICSLDYI